MTILGYVTWISFATAAISIVILKSVQGQSLDRIYGGDGAQLDADIDDELSHVRAIGAVAGKQGKTVQYPLGTTVTLRANARRFFSGGVHTGGQGQHSLHHDRRGVEQP